MTAHNNHEQQQQMQGGQVRLTLNNNSNLSGHFSSTTSSSAILMLSQQKQQQSSGVAYPGGGSISVAKIAHTATTETTNSQNVSKVRDIINTFEKGGSRRANTATICSSQVGVVVSPPALIIRSPSSSSSSSSKSSSSSDSSSPSGSDRQRVNAVGPSIKIIKPIVTTTTTTTSGSASNHPLSGSSNLHTISSLLNRSNPTVYKNSNTSNTNNKGRLNKIVSSLLSQAETSASFNNFYASWESGGGAASASKKESTTMTSASSSILIKNNRVCGRASSGPATAAPPPPPPPPQATVTTRLELMNLSNKISSASGSSVVVGKGSAAGFMVENKGILIKKLIVMPNKKITSICLKIKGSKLELEKLAFF